MTEPASPVLSTERLILRRWRESDRELFACLNADPEVMRHFLRPLTREESDAFVDRIEARFDERGYGLRAIRVMERIGLHRDPRDDFDYPNMPEGHPLRRHLLPAQARGVDPMTSEQPPYESAATESSAEAVDRVAGELEEVRRREVGKAVEYDRAGIVFAAREAGRLSFRLRADIAEHALRTPETSRSPRGREWVTVASEVTDTFTVDRAAAWFESAWRLAGDLPETGGAPN